MNLIFRSVIVLSAFSVVIACDARSKQNRQVEAAEGTSQQPEQRPILQDSNPSENVGAPAENDSQSAQPPSPPAESGGGSGETSQPTPSAPSADTLGVLKQYYDAELNSIIDSRCQICHGSQKDLNFSSFASVQADAAQMADAVENGRMPFDPSMLPADEKEKLLNFLNELVKVSR